MAVIKFIFLMHNIMRSFEACSIVRCHRLKQFIFSLLLWSSLLNIRNIFADFFVLSLLFIRWNFMDEIRNVHWKMLSVFFCFHSDPSLHFYLHCWFVHYSLSMCPNNVYIVMCYVLSTSFFHFSYFFFISLRLGVRFDSHKHISVACNHLNLRSCKVF